LFKLKGEKWSMIYGIFNYISQQFDAFRFYNVDEYLSAVGLSVQPDFRRRGIAGEILKARVPLCKAFDIKLTTTIFSAIGSQVPATRIGFVENYTIE
jgi:GNAT superfamily N-acetyltransferase